LEESTFFGDVRSGWQDLGDLKLYHNVSGEEAHNRVKINAPEYKYEDFCYAEKEKALKLVAEDMANIIKQLQPFKKPVVDSLTVLKMELEKERQ